jgi:hypothetical protein
VGTGHCRRRYGHVYVLYPQYDGAPIVQPVQPDNDPTGQQRSWHNLGEPTVIYPEEKLPDKWTRRSSLIRSMAHCLRGLAAEPQEDTVVAKSTISRHLPVVTADH